MANLHSHAFQRGMAGLGEARTRPGDDFWSWREVMYRFLDRIGPDEVEAIAAQLYVEMVEAGYGRVGRVPLPAPRPRRAALRRPAGDGPRPRAGGEDGGHRPDPGPGALHPLHLRRPRADPRPAPLHPDDRRSTCGCWTALAAEAGREGFDLGVSASTPCARSRPSRSPRCWPPRRSDVPIHIHVAEQTKEVERLPRLVGQAAGGVAARPRRAGRALAAGPRHPHDRGRGQGRRRDRRGGGGLPDHRGQPRRRLLPGRRLVRGQRGDRHRHRQPRLHRPARGAALVRVRPPAAAPEARPVRAVAAAQSRRRAVAGGGQGRRAGRRRA